MLETVRAFALEELSRSGEEDAVRVAHARWVDAFARDADTHVLGPDSGEWLTRYEREHDNFRTAIAWAVEHDPADLGLRVPESLWRFWELRGHYTEARGWLEQAVASSAEAPSKLRALALDGLGNIAWRQGDLVTATRALEESLGIWRATGERRSIGARSPIWGLLWSCAATWTAPRRCKRSRWRSPGKQVIFASRRR